ncbi:MAG: PASTA domain-containing protein, partial [Chloroflexota bacterium]|nr:PASTA domain-containing protein [Chloroflexota bacterium]
LLALAAGLVGLNARGGDGATTVTVPALEGLGMAEARLQLIARGLQPGRVDIAPLPGEPLEVVYQDPPAGTTVESGAQVNFVIRAPE